MSNEQSHPSEQYDECWACTKTIWMTNDPDKSVPYITIVYNHEAYPSVHKQVIHQVCLPCAEKHFNLPQTDYSILLEHNI